MRYYIVGPHREIVWPNWFNSRAQAEQWRKRWDWGKDCQVVAIIGGGIERRLRLRLETQL